MKNFQIKTTSNYNIFLHVIGNREINKANVNRLKESIKDRYSESKARKRGQIK